MSLESSAQRQVRRFAYPIALLILALAGVSAGLLGFSLIEPLARVTAWLVVAGVVVGTVLVARYADSTVILVTIGATALLALASTITLSGPSLRGPLLVLVQLLALAVLLLRFHVKRVMEPERPRLSRGLRYIILPFSILVFLGGAALSSLVLALGLLNRALPFSEETRHETPSPGGLYTLVYEYADQGATGSSSTYYLTQRPLPFVERRTELPFSDGYEHDVRWLDAKTLLVDKRRQVVGQPLAKPKTTNRGVSWTSRSSGTESNLFCIRFTDADTGWAVGEFGTILKTSDGGANWKSLSPGKYDLLFSVDFSDSNNGWVTGGGGTILRTKDGGRTWLRQPSGVKGELLSVRFVDSSTGWVTGEGGTILKTANGGRTWARQSSHTRRALMHAHFIDRLTGWAAGENGTILKTTDGGTTWRSQHSGVTNGLETVCFVDDKTGWAMGDGGMILKSVDGGAVWKRQVSHTPAYLRSAYFADANTGWAVGEPNKDGQPGVVLMTANGGRTWTHEPADATEGLYSITFSDTNTGWTVGAFGAMLKTTSSGQP